MTKKEIIIETVNHYSQNPEQLRSKINGTCLYNGDNTHCAVGRCMLTKYKKQGKNLEFNKGYSVWSVSTLVIKKESIDEILSPKYRGHSREFWEELQDLHDNDLFWNGVGLSGYGKEKMLVLLKIFKD